MGSPIKLKQKLSPKAAAAKKIRDKAAAMTPKRRARKAENQRIGQRSDSDLHHSSNGLKRVSVKNNRGNFGRGTKLVHGAQTLQRLMTRPRPNGNTCQVNQTGESPNYQTVTTKRKLLIQINLINGLTSLDVRLWKVLRKQLMEASNTSLRN